jgi:hypothetical protein
MAVVCGAPPAYASRAMTVWRILKSGRCANISERSLQEDSMRIPRIAMVALAIAPAMLSQVAFAKDGPTMNLGKWEVKTVSKSSMIPKEKVTTTTECVKEDKNPLEAIMEGGKCKVTKQETKGRTLTWEMECGQDYSAKGTGSFTADGDSGEGVMEMTMKIHNMEMNVKNTWTGKRVGDCD